MRVEKKKRDHHSYDEEVETTPEAIEDETGDIESETPALDNEPVEDTPEEEEPEPPVFEDE